MSSKDKGKNKETAPAPFPVQRHDVLLSKTTRYLVLDFIGEGCYGKVAKCLDLTANKLVAVKIHKEIQNTDIQEEVAMLKTIRHLDPEKNNIVSFIDNFKFQKLSCLAFEMLDRSLRDLVKERKLIPLSLNEMRPVIHQLLVAFDGLQRMGIIHTDLKPDNIMLVNQKHQPFKVKLIDFGLAIPVCNAYTGMTLQARAYRAPEVTLGLPLSEAVDMWGVGCIMSYLYFGTDLFSGKCAYQRMKAKVHILGQPEDNLLSAGINTWQYFSKEEGSIRPGWRLKSSEEYEDATGVKVHVSSRYFNVAWKLEDAVERYRERRDAVQYNDRMAFVSLLKACLHMDAERRITPRKALKHKFVQMVHLVEKMDASSYADEALQFMTVSPLKDMDELDHSDTDSFNHVSTDSSGGEDSDTDIFNGNNARATALHNGNRGTTTPTDKEFDVAVTSNNGDTNNECLLITINTDDDRPSAAIGSIDRARKSNTPTEEELDSAATSNDGNKVTGRLTITSNTNGDRDSAAVGSTDGDAAAIEPVDVHDVKKIKKNQHHRICNLFRRVKARVVSIFRH